jgi:2-iminobutanoate/2-iminopropanoate deaminase
MRHGYNPETVEKPGAGYSQVVISGDLVYTSGQCARDVNLVHVGSDIETQTRQTIRNIELLLESAGCSLDDVIKVTTFLGDNSYFRGYDKIYRELFNQPYPVRTTVAVEFDDATLIEMDVVARRPGG